MDFMFTASHEGYPRLLVEGTGRLVVPRTYIWLGRYQESDPSGG